MFTNLAPPQPLPITLVTDQLVIAGMARTRRQRITDLLNDAETLGLVVLEATFTDLATGETIASADISQVPLETILFAYARGETPGAPEMRMARKATPATLLTGPYTIEGLIHLPLEPDLKLAVEEFQGKFIAVTQARYRAHAKTNDWTEVDLIVANHARSFVAVTATESTDGEAAPDPLGPVESTGGW